MYTELLWGAALSALCIQQTGKHFNAVLSHVESFLWGYVLSVQKSA